MNENRIRLKVLGISYSDTPSQGYVLVVGEQHGERRVPIVIGASEAQSIALQIEGFNPPRPLTHDLFFQFAKSFGIEILEVNIVKLEEGVFFSELLCFNGEKELTLEARTSDAVALALRFRCPIFITEEIMERAGVVLDDNDDEEITKYAPSNDDDVEGENKLIINKSQKELNEMLMIAIDREDYEKASLIRDEIKRREKEGSNEPNTPTE